MRQKILLQKNLFTGEILINYFQNFEGQFFETLESFAEYTPKY